MRHSIIVLLVFAVATFAPLFSSPTSHAGVTASTTDLNLPENGRFEITDRRLDVGTDTSNLDFSLQPVALDPATYPANADFNTGALDGWSVSDTDQVVIQTDGAGPDGDYLWLQAPYQWAQSSSFTVPSDAQSIHFSYMAWTGQDATKTVPLHVAVLSGADFATVTNLPDVHGTHVQGWQAAVRDIQAFRGQTIKLQFQAERRNRGAQARVDSLSLYTDLPGWNISDAQQVAFQADSASPHDGYAWLKAPYHWVQSSPLTVPSDAQSIHFNYMAWTGRDATETVPLHVAVLSGTDFATVTNLPDVRGAHGQGWQQAVRDIQAFRGQTIKLQFQAERQNRGAQAYVDALAFYADVPG